MIVKDNSGTNKYISSIILNGQDYTRNYLPYKTIMQGGEIEITMTDKPGSFGTAITDRPHSVGE